LRTSEEFREFFRSELLPELRRFERKRREALRRFRTLRHPLFWAACLAAAWGLWSPLPLLAPVALLVGRAAWVRLRLRGPFKEQVVRRVIAFCDPALRYEPRAHVSVRRVRESGLFAEATMRVSGEDYVAGRVGETDVELSELRLVQGQGRSRRTVFSGLFFVADFHKSFRGRTLVLPDRTEWLLGGLGRALQLHRPFAGARLVPLEDPVFERYFAVYGSDPLETRYLLSPSLMERLVRFRESTGASLRVAFFDECIYLAIPLKTEFLAVSFSKSLVNDEAVQTWMSELAFALGIVEELDLNTRIWSKGPDAATV
jgi:hypothetical protein